MAVGACEGGGLVNAWGRFFFSGRDELVRWGLCGSVRVCDLRRDGWFMRSWWSFCFCSCSFRCSYYCSCSCSLFIVTSTHSLFSHNSHPKHTFLTQLSPQPAKHAQSSLSISNSCNQAHIGKTPRTASTGRTPVPEGCQITCLSARCWDGHHLR